MLKWDGPVAFLTGITQTFGNCDITPSSSFWTRLANKVTVREHTHVAHNSDNNFDKTFVPCENGGFLGACVNRLNRIHLLLARNLQRLDNNENCQWLLLLHSLSQLKQNICTLNIFKYNQISLWLIPGGRRHWLLSAPFQHSSIITVLDEIIIFIYFFCCCVLFMTVVAHFCRRSYLLLLQYLLRASFFRRSMISSSSIITS